MENFFFVKDEKQLRQYQDFLLKHQTVLQNYIDVLKTEFAVEELPRAAVWADKVSATQIIRQIPIPAYTNDVRMVMTPDLEVWKEIYLRQIDVYDSSEEINAIKEHYQNLSENHLLQIVGHELAHWSEQFLDDFDAYDSYIWFEEGMVEYISRQYFLTDEEFQSERAINRLLVGLFQEKYGWHSLNEFGNSTYDGNYASIFYEYWRSFLVIDSLVDKLGSVQAVFQIYQQWADTDKTLPLLDWLLAHKFLENDY